VRTFRGHRASVVVERGRDLNGVDFLDAQQVPSDELGR
jgi:hypothetical protein